MQCIGSFALRFTCGAEQLLKHRVSVEDDILCGLSTVIHIQHPVPWFEAAHRYTLTNPELKNAVFNLTFKAMESFAEKHPEQMRRIVEKCLKNKALRLHRRCGN